MSQVTYSIATSGSVYVTASILEGLPDELARRLAPVSPLSEEAYFGRNSNQLLSCDKLILKLHRFDQRYGLDRLSRQLLRDIETEVENLREIAKRDS